MFLSLDGTFWFQLANFALFFALLNAVFLRPVGVAIRQRRAYIDGVQADYERYSQEAASVRVTAEAKRAAARREADELLARARAAAEDAAAATVTERTAQAQTIVDRARATVAAEIAAAKRREAALTETLAKALLERALGAAS